MLLICNMNVENPKAYCYVKIKCENILSTKLTTWVESFDFMFVVLQITIHRGHLKHYLFYSQLWLLNTIKYLCMRKNNDVIYFPIRVTRNITMETKTSLHLSCDAF